MLRPYLIQEKIKRENTNLKPYNPDYSFVFTPKNIMEAKLTEEASKSSISSCCGSQFIT